MLREEEKRRKRVNQGLPKVIDEIKTLTQEYFDQNGKEFLIQGMAFDGISDHKEAKHNQEVSMEKEKKKEEKKKLIGKKVKKYDYLVRSMLCNFTRNFCSKNNE